jgi:hypothetical protein
MGPDLSVRGVTATNSIIANNTSTSTDCKGGAANAIQSGGNNLDSDGSCAFSGSGDLSGVNPLLGALANNAGPTKTHALLTGNPAIGAGNDSAAPATDQVGTSRPQGSAGAFEVVVTVEPVPGVTTWGLAALAAMLGAALLFTRRAVGRGRLRA